jgi:hypothetical protein
MLLEPGATRETFKLVAAHFRLQTPSYFSDEIKEKIIRHYISIPRLPLETDS